MCPDYGMNEVADHAIALALSVTRKVTEKDEPDYKAGGLGLHRAIPVHRFSEMTVGVIGAGADWKKFRRENAQPWIPGDRDRPLF